MTQTPPQSELPPSDSSREARRGSARRRQMARQARRGNVAPPQRSMTTMPADRKSDSDGLVEFIVSGAQEVLRNITWQSISGRAPLIGVALVVLVVLFSISSMYGAGTVLPGVNVSGIGLRGMDEAQAISALTREWNEKRITLQDGERSWVIPLKELGFEIDAVSTARRALRYGREQGGLSSMLRAALGGVDLEPDVEFNLDVARDSLAHYAEEVRVRPQNASLHLQGVVVTHIAPENGRRLNTAELLAGLAAVPGEFVASGTIQLPMETVYPVVVDATPLVEYAQSLLANPISIAAYDPVSDEEFQFQLQPDVWGRWLDTRLEYHPTGPRLYLSVDPLEVRSYLHEEARRLPEPLTIDFNDGVTAIQNSVSDGSLNTWVTIRYLPTVHTVERGETAYSISRTQGIPFYLIEEANEGKDLSELFVGDEVNLPSRDSMLPLRPVRGKRIIVDLSDQYLTAYENDQVVFEWLVSTGISTAPTSTGVFQILSHDEVAYGSSFTLCDENTCGRWVMHWFMGIYEAVPGLVNGFHGAVELPDGRYLGGGNVGRPYTFGCIMSVEDNAIALYEWAEDGVVVEIRP